MRNPEKILNNLITNTKKEDYKFQRLYRNMFNEELYLMAYAKLAPNSGNLTEGTSGTTIDGFSLKLINDIIEKMKTEKYQPKPARRVYILKKNGKKRPLGIPSFEDKLVQEVIRLMLEAIYDETFSDSSHGFRPNRSCHTALAEVKCKFTGGKWFVEGDICSFFDNINHQILIKLLKKKISDERFIRLIWKFLRAGYLEDWTFHKTFSGTPQGGIISPILSNIYLDELDKFMSDYKNKFDKGKSRTKNKAYTQTMYKISKLEKEIEKVEKNTEERELMILELKGLREKLLTIPYSIPIDNSYRRLFYVRYADDFIISVIGSKNDAEIIKNDIENFLSKELDIKLSPEKTLITHSNTFARFLGYDIAVSRNEQPKRNQKGNKKRNHNYRCNLYLPKDVWINKAKEFEIIRQKKNGIWRPAPRPYLIHLSDIEIINIYNAEIRGIYNYYKLAKNVSVLNKFMYFMKYSMFMTFASKYKSSVAKIIKKYSRDKIFSVKYETKEGIKSTVLYNKGFCMDINANKNYDTDFIPTTFMYRTSSELTQRLLANKCEWCGKTDEAMEVHHIKKLKDLQGKKIWEQVMIARRRKTMVLCVACHHKLHQGKLD